MVTQVIINNEQKNYPQGNQNLYNIQVRKKGEKKATSSQCKTLPQFLHEAHQLDYLAKGGRYE